MSFFCFSVPLFFNLKLSLSLSPRLRAKRSSFYHHLLLLCGGGCFLSGELPSRDDRANLFAKEDDDADADGDGGRDSGCGFVVVATVAVAAPCFLPTPALNAAPAARGPGAG